MSKNAKKKKNKIKRIEYFKSFGGEDENEDKCLLCDSNLYCLDLKNGKCVQLVQGEPGTEQVIIDNPDEVAMNWIQKGAKRLHVVDLDGALGSGENLNIVKKIIEKSQVPVQMGGGIRTLDDAKKLLDAGITTVIIGTMAIKNPEYIEQLSEEYGSERICVSLDSKDNKVVTHGWTEFTDKSLLEYAIIFER